MKKAIEKDFEYLNNLYFFIQNIIRLNFEFSGLKMKNGDTINNNVKYNLFLYSTKKTGLIDESLKFTSFGYKLDIQPYLSVAEGYIENLDNVNQNNEKKSKSILKKLIALDFNYFISETDENKFIFLTNKQQKKEAMLKTKSKYNHNIQLEKKDIKFPFINFNIIGLDKIKKDLLNLKQQIPTKTDIKNNNYYNFEYILHLLKQHIDKFHDILKKYKISDKKFNDVFLDYSKQTIYNNRFLGIIKILRTILKEKIETLDEEIKIPDEKFIHTFTNYVIKKYNLIRYKKEYLTEEDKALKKFKELENKKIIIFIKNDNGTKKLEVKLKIFYGGIKLISDKQDEFDFLTNEEIISLLQLEEKDEQVLYKNLQKIAKEKIKSLLPITDPSGKDFGNIQNLNFLVKSFQSLNKLKFYSQYKIQKNLIEFLDIKFTLPKFEKDIRIKSLIPKPVKGQLKCKIKFFQPKIKTLSDQKYQILIDYIFEQDFEYNVIIGLEPNFGFYEEIKKYTKKDTNKNTLIINNIDFGKLNDDNGITIFSIHILSLIFRQIFKPPQLEKLKNKYFDIYKESEVKENMKKLVEELQRLIANLK